MPARQYFLAAAAALLAACAAQPQHQAEAPVNAVAPAADDRGAGESRKLNALFEEYFEESLKLDPLLATSIGDPRYNDRLEISIAPEWRTRAVRVARDYLARARQIDRGLVTGQDLLSHEMFVAARERDIEGFRYPSHLVPLNQFYSMPNSFAQLGSGNGKQPFKTVKDYEDFLKRVDGFVTWTDQAIANMREGVAKGYTLPRVLAERVLPQLQAHVVARAEDSLYWGPVTNLPASFDTADRERLTAAYRAAIETKIVPSHRRLHDFMRDEYLPKCRTSVGLDALPDGKAWYEYNVRSITTTDYTPAQVHEIGLREVERIHGEIRGVMAKVGFKGTLDEFFAFLNTDPQFVHPSREALIQGYVDIKNRVDPRLPRLFEILPKADYEVRAVEPFREMSAAGGSYVSASQDGTRPGIFTRQRL
jgi:uncharacterized protein (DUF885 family)